MQIQHEITDLVSGDHVGLHARRYAELEYCPIPEFPVDIQPAAARQGSRNGTLAEAGDGMSISSV